MCACVWVRRRRRDVKVEIEGEKEFPTNNSKHSEKTFQSDEDAFRRWLRLEENVTAKGIALHLPLPPPLHPSLPSSLFEFVYLENSLFPIL